MIPAPAQGAMVYEVTMENDHFARSFGMKLNHAETGICTLNVNSFKNTEGGCTAPIRL